MNGGSQCLAHLTGISCGLLYNHLHLFLLNPAAAAVPDLLTPLLRLMRRILGRFMFGVHIIMEHFWLNVRMFAGNWLPSAAPDAEGGAVIVPFTRNKHPNNNYAINKHRGQKWGSSESSATVQNWQLEDLLNNKPNVVVNWNMPAFFSIAKIFLLKFRKVILKELKSS